MVRVCILRLKKFSNPDYTRPKKFSKKDSLASDVILDVLKNLLKFEYFIYLQLTSPLRAVRDIDNSLKMIETGQYPCVSH